MKGAEVQAWFGSDEETMCLWFFAWLVYGHGEFPLVTVWIWGGALWCFVVIRVWFEDVPLLRRAIG